MARTSLRRRLLVALVLLLVVGLAAPAEAGSSASQRRRREAVRSQRARAAAKLNALKATDAQLEAAVRTLDAQVRAEQAKVDAERRRVVAAERAIARAEANVSAARADIEHIRAAVRDRAVAAYVRPQTEVLNGLVSSRDFNDASRRTTLLAQVANRDRDAIDQLRAAKQDYEEERAAADQARAVAEARRQQVAVRLGEVKRVRDDKAKVERELDKRIRELQGEVDAMARSEASLTNLLRNDTYNPGAISTSGLMWPLRGRLTSGYGRRWGRMHAGIDIAAPRGTPIRSAKAGQVIFAGTMSGYGNVVIVSHGGGFSTLYAHQSRIASSRGQSVDRGQVIGYVGSTGRSTGNHLHFETRVNGSAQNPRRYLA